MLSGGGQLGNFHAGVLKALAEQLVNLTIKDVTELTNIMEEEYGIKPAAAAVAVAGPAAGGGDA